jgi:hypothetical protein
VSGIQKTIKTYFCLAEIILWIPDQVRDDSLYVRDDIYVVLEGLTITNYFDIIFLSMLYSSLMLIRVI